MLLKFSEFRGILYADDAFLDETAERAGSVLREMKKRPEQNTGQDERLELQMQVSEKARWTDCLTIILLGAILFGFGIGIYVREPDVFSEQENRYLTQLPSASSAYSGDFFGRVREGKLLDRLIAGDFTAEMADFYADQLPFRNAFVGLKGICEIASLKQENDGAVLGRDGYLIKRCDYADCGMMLKNLDSMIAFAQAMEADGIPCTLAVAGRTADVMRDKLPALFPWYRTRTVWEALEARVAETGVSYLPLCDRLTALNEKGAAHPLYYRTDHHWTSWGAYYAYAALCEELGVEPLAESDLTEQAASDSFYGTTWSSAGLKWIAPDTMLFLRYEGDTGYTTCISDSGKRFSGFYDESCLEKKDKYSAFIGGNNALVYVTKDGAEEDRGRLLLIKDSFAHSMAPFLAYHWDLVIVDTRYYKQSVRALAKAEGVERVLILANMGGMTEANVYGVLTFGLDE